MKYGGTVLGDHPKNQMTIVLKKGKGGLDRGIICTKLLRERLQIKWSLKRGVLSSPVFHQAFRCSSFLDFNTKKSSVSQNYNYVS